jgi:hypothetical protein
MTVYARGIDYSFQHPSSPQAIKMAGYSFIVRYMYPSSQIPGTKNLTHVEAINAINAGLVIVSNYESWESEALDGFNAGISDARAANAQHLACGGDPRAPIYFSVDFDTNPSQYPQIDQYFKGVASVLTLGRTGGYGEYELIKHLFDRGLIWLDPKIAKGWGWQTYAWSAGAYDERCALAQDQNGIIVGGAQVDLDTAHTPYFGQWPYKGNIVPPIEALSAPVIKVAQSIQLPTQTILTWDPVPGAVFYYGLGDFAPVFTSGCSVAVPKGHTAHVRGYGTDNRYSKSSNTVAT